MKLKQLFAAALLLVSAGAWAQTDVTSTYLTNAGFDNCTAETSDVAAKTIKDYSTVGWTNASSGSFTTIAATAYGGGVKVGGSSTPTTKKDGTTVLGNTLGIIAGWGDNVTIQSGDITLQAGAYTLTVDHYLTSSTTNYNNTSSKFGFVTSGQSYLVSSTTFTASSWTTETVTFNLTESTTGKIQIGLTGLNKSGSGSPAVFYDDVTITWTDPLQAGKDALQAEIDKAKLCDAKEDLADAIATAEGVLTSATTTTELDDALAALQAADKDAVLRYENGLADATYAAPIVTNFVINGTFDNSDISMWSCNTSFQNRGRKTGNDNNAGTMNNSKPWWENWNGSALVNKMYQTVTNIPNGTYRLDITAFVNKLEGTQYVFANNDQIPLTEAGTGVAYEVWTVVTNNQVEVGLEQTTATANWMGIDNVSLRYYGAGDVINDAKNAAHKLAWEEAKAAAEAAIANGDYANVTGSEKTALQTEIAKAEPTTAAGYDDASAALNTATAAFTAAKANYDALVTEIAYAKTIGVTTADDYAATSASTAASVVTSTQALKVMEYSTINAAYPNDVTSLIGDWDKGNYDTTSGQSYQGGSESYFDKWSGSATDLTSSMTVSLPSGQFALMVAGRGVSTTTMSLSVQVGDDEPINTPFLMIGDTGKGIDTDGATNFDESGTYSNSNAGRGWQYRYITFEGGSDVTITISGHLNANTWQSFYAPVLLCNDETYAPIAVEAAKADLRADIDGAPAIRTANVGDGVFQIAQTGVTTYSDALDAAEAVWNDDAATLATITDAQTALENAINAYNALEVNAPADGQLFNVVLTYGGWTYDQKAMTYIANGRTDMGNYNIQYKEAANQNLAQAFTFTKVSGNNYKMSQIDADGNVRYISTGVPYSGNTAQIRTTTNADDALAVEIIPTATDGVWNLRNTEANNYIGSQDAGVFTVNSHIDFNIVETTKPSITINTTAAGWGTTMLPFAVASLPTDVKAYSVSELDGNGNSLTLVEVTALEANKPYIIEGAWEETLTGDALGIALTYTDGLLTGTYSDMEAINDTYVLQKHIVGGNYVVGFFQVDTNEATPTVKANRAYLTAPAPTGVKAFVLGDIETAIKSVMDGVVAGEIYDLSGRKVSKMEKGNVYIVNGKKVAVK